MKRAIAILLFSFLTLSELMASGPLLKAVQQPTDLSPTRTNGYYLKSYRVIQDVTDILKGYIYTDLQCTKTLPAEEGLVRAVYATNNSNRLVFILYDGECGNLAIAKLYLSDSQGNILDNKEVYIDGAWDGLLLKDFAIEDGKIKIYSIKPTSSHSLAFSDFGQKFTSFTGTRYDEEYVIDGNKFKLKKRTSYNPKTYTYSQIHTDTFKIWNGTETVINVQTF